MYEYTHHPVTNHVTLDFGKDHEFRKLDWADKNLKKLKNIEQRLIYRPFILAEYEMVEK